MTRIKLFEFEDLSWFPNSIRDAGTDILRFMWEKGRVYKPIVPILKRVLKDTGTENIVDLASGGGGPMDAVYGDLVKILPDLQVTLTDKYPNIHGMEYIARKRHTRIKVSPLPINAADVPEKFVGLRTMFCALHHFTDTEAEQILNNTVRQRQPISIFDFPSFPSPPPFAVPILTNPITVLLMSPFIKPFRWKRILWTYTFIVPLFVLWDGFVSAIRMYSTARIKKLVSSLEPNDYHWEIGTTEFPNKITYLIGYPPKN